MKALHQRPLRPFAMLLAGCLCLPGLPAEAARMVADLPDTPAMGNEPDGEWLAKKGGKGGGGKNTGGSRKKASKGSSGFKSSGSGLSKGSKQPKGGWSKKTDSKNSPSLKSKGSQDNKNKQARRDDRLDKQEKKADRRDDRLDKQEKKADRRDDRLDKRDKKLDKRADRIDDRWDDRWDRWDDRWDRYPGWARPGWGYARPWNYGWYDGGYYRSGWNWWGANAAAWGLTTLTTAAIINAAVDDAVSNQTTYVVVPNTDYRLLYGTVEPVNDQSVRFAVEAGSGETYFDADCNRGTLNGRNPSSASEAELLNAACQVAFGSV